MVNPEGKGDNGKGDDRGFKTKGEKHMATVKYSFLMRE